MEKMIEEIKNSNNEVTKRLDVLIKLEIQKIKKEFGSSFNLSEPAKLLQNSGFSPSEIAKILDKKGATAVAYLLYNNKKSGVKNAKNRKK